MGAFLRNGFAHVDNVNCYPRDQSNHMAAPVKVARQQTTPELSGTFRTLRNLHQHQHTPELSGREPSETRLPTPAHTGTLRNFPEPSKTFRNLPPEPTPAYTGTPQNRPEPSTTCLRNRRHFTAELCGTFRNLPPERTPAYAGTPRNLPEPASGTYTSTRRNSQELSGTRLRNLHQHTPELSGTFRNLPPEPAPATRTGTHRSLSGLKTPVAYAVGEKCSSKMLIWKISHSLSLSLPETDMDRLWYLKTKISQLSETRWVLLRLLGNASPKVVLVLKNRQVWGHHQNSGRILRPSTPTFLLWSCLMSSCLEASQPKPVAETGRLKMAFADHSAAIFARTRTEVNKDLKLNGENQPVFRSFFTIRTWGLFSPGLRFQLMVKKDLKTGWVSKLWPVEIQKNRWLAADPGHTPQAPPLRERQGPGHGFQTGPGVTPGPWKFGTWGSLDKDGSGVFLGDSPMFPNLHHSSDGSLLEQAIMMAYKRWRLQ